MEDENDKLFMLQVHTLTKKALKRSPGISEEVQFLLAVNQLKEYIYDMADKYVSSRNTLIHTSDFSDSRKISPTSTFNAIRSMKTPIPSTADQISRSPNYMLANDAIEEISVSDEDTVDEGAAAERLDIKHGSAPIMVERSPDKSTRTIQTNGGDDHM